MYRLLEGGEHGKKTDSCLEVILRPIFNFWKYISSANADGQTKKSHGINGKL